jgi:hypothetical protein
MFFRKTATLVLLGLSVLVAAQDYAPFSLGHTWIFDIYESGTIVGTETQECELVEIRGDTTFYHVSSFLDFTDGRPDEGPDINLFFEVSTAPNDVYVRSILDLLYFKHTPVDGESWSAILFTITNLYTGDYELPSGKIYPDCFWMKINQDDSTGFVLAPDLGIIAAYEAGELVRSLQQSTLLPVGYDEISICEGDSVMLHDRYVSDEGIYRDTIPGLNGDSVAVTTLMILEATESTEDVIICEGESYFAGGADQTESGTYYDTLQNAAGCDSVVITELTVEDCTTGFDSSNEEVLRAYPNPTTGIIMLSDADIERVEVYNLLGEKVHVSHLPTVDLTGFSEGCYYLKVLGGQEEVKVLKVILRK